MTLKERRKLMSAEDVSDPNYVLKLLRENFHRMMERLTNRASEPEITPMKLVPSLPSQDLREEL